MPEHEDGPADFFISRAGADKGMAMRIAAIIRGAGLKAFYQDEHFGHSDFMRRMEQGYESGRMIALLSEEYQNSEHCRAEYNHHLGKDPSNLKGRLIVLRVAPWQPIGSLQNLAYTDLVPVLNDEAAFRKVVRAALGVDKDNNTVPYWRSFERPGQQILHSDIREVKGFTGREDLLQSLKEKLAKKTTVAIRNSDQTTLALRGMGGVGKTVLAQEYAWRNRKDYQGVWWIRAETRETFVDDLIAFGKRFIPGLESLEPEEAAKKTLEQLAQVRTERPWLLVCDNVEDPTLIRKLTPADNAHVLITSRETPWYGEADEQLAVDVFDAKTAVAYLLEHARHPDRDGAERLAKALGYLPLALSHARAYCWERDWSFDEYVAKLPELIDKTPKNAPYPASVFATFDLAIKKAAEHCPEAERLMELISFYAPEQIPLWLIPSEVMSETGRGDALAALEAVSLVAFEKATDGTRAVSVHRLVQQAVRGRLKALVRFDEVAAEAVRLLYQSYDEHSSTVETLRRRAAWLPHALAVFSSAPKDGEAAKYSVWVAVCAGDFRITRGDTPGASEAYQFAIEIALAAVSVCGDDETWQSALALAYNRAGKVFQGQGNFAAALARYSEALAIEQRRAKSHPDDLERQHNLSIAYYNVSRTFWWQKKYAEALAASRHGLAIMEHLARVNPDRIDWQRGLLVSHMMVGDALVAQGKRLDCYRQALSICERITKIDPTNAEWQRDLSISYESVGDVLAMEGKFADALSFYDDTFKIRWRLAKADQGNALWKGDLKVICLKYIDTYWKWVRSWFKAVMLKFSRR